MIPLSDSIKSRSFPILVLLVIAINIYVFFLEITSADPEGFIRKYALIPAELSIGTVRSLLSLITSMFLHGGWLHIGSNMLFLWVFGDNIEDALGKLRFFIFYMLCGIAAGLMQYIIDPSSTIPMVGASGAIAGVLGAYWSLYPTSRINTLIPIGFFVTTAEIPAGIMIGLWFLIQLLSGSASIANTTASSGGVAFWAHIGGFIAGLILVRVFPPKKPTFWKVD
ncbi:MAG: rhomboid family intramembrane serine protease [bacterium]|nr:rhomboid family intramembrane serine protease [bacterium]